MGVVVDTPGAVTCALRGRPKSEGITVHTWSCDGSLAGPLLLEFIVGWSCAGLQVERWLTGFVEQSGLEAVGFSPSFSRTTPELEQSRGRSAQIQADTTQLTQVCECELVPATRTGNPGQKLTGLLRKPWRRVSLVYPHVRFLFPLVVLEVVAKRKNWRQKLITSPCASH